MQLVVLLAPGADSIPTYAVIEGEGWVHLPTILREGRHIEVAVVKAAGLALRIAGSDAEQEIGEVQAGLRAVEGKAAVEDHVGVGVDLIAMYLSAHFESVLAQRNAR